MTKATGQVDVEEHDIGLLGLDDADRGLDVGSLPDDFDPVAASSASSLRTPLRNIRWSSTGRRESAGSCVCSFQGGQSEFDLGAVLAATHPGGATMALHPAQDGLAHAEPVLGHRVQVEAGAAVADEGLHPARPDLHVGRDRRLPVSRALSRASRRARASAIPCSSIGRSPVTTSSTGTLVRSSTSWLTEAMAAARVSSCPTLAP